MAAGGMYRAWSEDIHKSSWRVQNATQRRRIVLPQTSTATTAGVFLKENEETRRRTIDGGSTSATYPMSSSSRPRTRGQSRRATQLEPPDQQQTLPGQLIDPRTSRPSTGSVQNEESRGDPRDIPPGQDRPPPPAIPTDGAATVAAGGGSRTDAFPTRIPGSERPLTEIMDSVADPVEPVGNAPRPSIDRRFADVMMNMSSTADSGGGGYPNGNSSAGANKPKGTYFNDGKRRIDFVLTYEKIATDDLNANHPPPPPDPNHPAPPNAANNVVSADPKRKAANAKKTNSAIDEAKRRQFFLDNLRKAGLEVEIDEQQQSSSDSAGNKSTNDSVKVLGFVKINAPWPVLCREAEILRMKMPLILEDLSEEDRSDEHLDEHGGESFWSKLWNLKFLEIHPDDDAKGERITWPFSRKRMDRFDIGKRGGIDGFFTECQRTEIVWEILQQCRNDPNHEKRRGIEALLEHHVFSEAFPLHDGGYALDDGEDIDPSDNHKLTTRQILYYQWANWKSTFRPQPLNRIRNYFGEKVAFYFAFMDMYTKMLIFPSVFGLVAFIYGLVSTATVNKPLMDSICDENDEPGNFVMCPICKPPSCVPSKLAHESCAMTKWEYRMDNEGTFVLSCLTILWCALFLKFWKRREAALAAEWDTSGVGGEDGPTAVVIRPAFEERAREQRRHPVTMELEPYIPKQYRVLWISTSILATFLMLLLAGACLTGLVISRIQLYGAMRNWGWPFADYSVELARFGIHGLIFIMVIIFETIYHSIADKLTEFECPKTPGEFLSSLLWKVFIFAQFVDFLPIAYAAWFKGRAASTPLQLDFISEICEPTGCMNEVCELVSVLLLCRLVFGNIGEVGIPFLTTLVARLRAAKNNGENDQEDGQQQHSSWPQYLKDFHLNELELDGVAEEYMEMMIQLSFVVFFVPALPLAGLLCLLNNIAEIRVDGLNFIVSHRRPLPIRVPGIQIWNKFMEIILKVGVLCNAALLAFTSEIVPRLYYKYGSGLSNGSYLGYPQFVFSTVNVKDWHELNKYVEEKLQEQSAMHNVSHAATGAGASDHHIAAEEHGEDAATRTVQQLMHGVATATASVIQELMTEAASGDHHVLRKRSAAAIDGHSASVSAEEESVVGGGHHELDLSNVTKCYYLDMRDPVYPYNRTENWWIILCLRLATFAAFVVTFYVLIFLCNFLISDTPKSVEQKMKRRRHIVAKALESGGEAFNRWRRGVVIRSGAASGVAASVRGGAGVLVRPSLEPLMTMATTDKSGAPVRLAGSGGSCDGSKNGRPPPLHPPQHPPPRVIEEFRF